METQPHWGILLLSWGSWSQRAARGAPRANAEVPPHPGRISSHPQIRNPSIYLQRQQPGDENGDPPRRYRPAQCGIPNQTGGLLIGWGSWSQRPAGGHGCPSGQGRVRAADGDVKVPSPHQKYFHISTVPTNRGSRRWSPASIPLHTL